MSAPEFVIGHVVDGKYAIQGVLNHAGVIATYRAATDSNQQVALKFYDPRLAAFPEVVNALTQCETLLAELPGNLVVRITDGGKDPETGALYTVTPFDADPSLGELVEWSPLSPSEMIVFVHSLARVLDAVHAHGIAHLSLKPANLFVGPGPAYNVRVVDFATSLVRSALASREEREASAEWLAPEQRGPGANGGPAADVFASALIAFYALTGKSYRRSVEARALDDAAWQKEMAHGSPSVSRRAGELSVSLDSAFDPAFARALAISPEDRFPTVGQFADALAAAIQAPAATTSNAATDSAKATYTVDDLLAADVDEPGPTSTSAVVLAPSVPPEGARPSLGSMPAAVDVPPPPPQMDAVLASFETAAPERFRIGSDAKPSSGRRRRSERVPAAAAPRKRSALFWIAGVAAGALVAAGIVWKISVGKNATAGWLARAASSPAAAATATSELPAAPASAIAPSDDAALSTNAAAVADSRARPPAAKPSAKTVRSPSLAQPRTAPSSAPRKPCGKSLKPCK